AARSLQVHQRPIVAAAQPGHDARRDRRGAAPAEKPRARMGVARLLRYAAPQRPRGLSEISRLVRFQSGESRSASAERGRPQDRRVHGRRGHSDRTCPRGFPPRRISLGRDRHEGSGVRRSRQSRGAGARGRRARAARLSGRGRHLAQRIAGRRALELRGGAPQARAPSTLSADTLRAVSLDSFFDLLGVRLNGPRAEGKTISINWNFTDVGEQYALNLENAALTHTRGLAEDAQASLTLTRATLDAIVLKQTTFAEQVLAGKTGVAGDSGKLIGLLGLLDDSDPMFGIVAPKQ